MRPLVPNPHLALVAEPEPEDLGQLSMPDLRTRRVALQEVEYGYSYARRVVQGRLDILLGELERRGSGVPEADLMDVMPETLGQKIRGPGLPRPTGDLEPPAWADELLTELDGVVHPGELTNVHEVDLDELADVAQRVSAIEHDLSVQRHELHQRIDRVQAELISRYREGASIDDLLT